MGSDFEAEYYDGLSPMSIKGRLAIRENGIEFNFETLEGGPQILHLKYDEVLDVAHIQGQTALDLVGDQEGVTRRFIIAGSHAHNLLRAHWSNKKSNPISALAIKFHGLPLDRMIGYCATALVFVIIGYFTLLSVVYHVVPVSADKSLGEYIDESVSKEVTFCENAELKSTLENMVRKLKPEDSPYNYNLKIINDSEVNAFALPGGFIYINSGLLRESGSAIEVAGVLAHELSHVELRHSMRHLIRVMGISFLTAMVVGGSGAEELELAEFVSEVAGVLLILKNSRAFESEADENAAKLMNAAKIDPGGLVKFFEKLIKAEESENESDYSDITTRTALNTLNWLSTHPGDEERIRFFRQVRTEMLKDGIVFRSPPGAGNKWNRIKNLCTGD